MPRKESVTIDRILETGFEMAREEGLSGVTARRVAAKAGCSTQPIFRVYENMEELQGAVYVRAVSFFQEYYAAYPKVGETPFSNLGLAYISFARKERKLFELLFVSDMKNRKSLYEVLNADCGNIVQEISSAREMGCKNPEAVFMKMWIFIHGAACMSLTGDYDLSDAETKDLLEKTYGDYTSTASKN